MLGDKNKPRPVYDPVAYTAAEGFMRHLRKSLKWISREDFSRIRHRALSGDIDGASQELCRLLDEIDAPDISPYRQINHRPDR